MDKRYQVFVSSTYADLKDERQRVIQVLMEMDCIPAGMELFPAADEEQWNFIKKVIDDCDYYVLIIGGRYGSMSADGISYTEKEFDYAIHIGLKIVALIHDKPDDIPFGKSEKDPDLRARLETFKQKVKAGRLVRFWSSAGELPGLVALSLSKTIKTYPAIGWMRASAAPKETVLLELNELRKQNAELKDSLRAMSSIEKRPISDIARLDSACTLRGKYKGSNRGEIVQYDYECRLSWRELFALIAPYILEHPNDYSVRVKLSESLFERTGKRGHSPRINEQEFKTVGVQLKAYGLIQITYSQTTKGSMGLFWSLTERGERLMIETRVVREQPKPSSPDDQG